MVSPLLGRNATLSTLLRFVTAIIVAIELWEPPVWAALAYLAFVATAVAYLIFYHGVRVIGPTPLEDAEPGPAGEPVPHRALLFFGYGIAAEVTRRLRATRAKASALRKHPPVHVRCDVTDLL